MIIYFLFWVSAILLIYTYLGFYLILLILANLQSKRREKDMHHTPMVSMLISAFNEEKVIEKKIKNCLDLDYPKDKIEILIGSDGSNDKTNDILQEFKNEFIKLFVFEQRRGKANVLNDLVDHAKGDILIFSDANTIYLRNALKYMVQYFVDPQIGGVCGKLELISLDDKYGEQGETLYWSYENRIKYLEGKIKTVLGANGGIYAIRKLLFQKLPVSIMVNDDFLVPLRIVKQGYDVIYEAEAIGRETTSLSIKGEFTRRVRIGAANFNVLKEIAPLLAPRRGFVAFALWSHKILRWFAPFLLIFLFISNIFLIGSWFFNTLFIAQLVFYLVSLSGSAISNSKRGRKVTFLSYCYYFASMNLALLVGFMKFLFKTQKPTWAKVER